MSAKRLRTSLTAITVAALTAVCCGRGGQEPTGETPAGTEPAAAIEKPAGRLIHVGDHDLYLECQGEGFPTVVLDVGLGDSIDDWAPFRDRLAGATRVCAYDRAGYGRSEPGPVPRDAGRMAAELELLLEGAGETTPVLLVGHSLGALNVYLLAVRRPRMAAEAVLLEPPPLGFIAGDAFPELRQMADRMTRDFEAGAAAAAESKSFMERQQADHDRMVASEHRALFEGTAREFVRAYGRCTVPLIVVGSGRPNPEFGENGAAFQEFWNRENRDLANRSARGRFILIQDSGHFLHLDAPDRVLEILQGEIERIRAAGPPPSEPASNRPSQHVQ